jgi:hypothetical protein
MSPRSLQIELGDELPRRPVGLELEALPQEALGRDTREHPLDREVAVPARLHDVVADAAADEVVANAAYGI